MTALIDVVFLLLLFFMLTSTFSTFGEIELSRASGAETSNEAAMDRFFVQLGKDRLTLNGTPVALDTLDEALEEGLVLVSLDEDVTAQRLVDLLTKLRGRSALSVQVLE